MTVTVGRSLPSWSRYQRATTNIQSTYERPTMARCTPEQAIRQRAWRQAARPRHARVRSPAARRPGGRCRHAPGTAPNGPHPAHCAPAHVHAHVRVRVQQDLPAGGGRAGKAARAQGRQALARAGRAAEPDLGGLAARRTRGLRHPRQRGDRRHRHHRDQEPARFGAEPVRAGWHRRRGADRPAAQRPPDLSGTGTVLPDRRAHLRRDLRPVLQQDRTRRRRGPVDRQRILRDGTGHAPGYRADHGALVHVASRPARPGR